jgi:hypothetical protein
LRERVTPQHSRAPSLAKVSAAAAADMAADCGAW